MYSKSTPLYLPLWFGGSESGLWDEGSNQRAEAGIDADQNIPHNSTPRHPLIAGSSSRRLSMTMRPNGVHGLSLAHLAMLVPQPVAVC